MKKILSAVFAFLLSFAVAEPVATPTDLAGDGDVSVSIKLVTPADEIRYGNIITMECVVEGTNDAFEVFWEYSEDGVHFHLVEQERDRIARIHPGADAIGHHGVRRFRDVA